MFHVPSVNTTRNTPAAGVKLLETRVLVDVVPAVVFFMPRSMTKGPVGGVSAMVSRSVATPADDVTVNAGVHDDDA